MLHLWICFQTFSIYQLRDISLTRQRHTDGHSWMIVNHQNQFALYLFQCRFNGFSYHRKNLFLNDVFFQFTYLSLQILI